LKTAFFVGDWKVAVALQKDRSLRQLLQESMQELPQAAIF
jgi:hypothetical protein